MSCKILLLMKRKEYSKSIENSKNERRMNVTSVVIKEKETKLHMN